MCQLTKRGRDLCGDQFSNKTWLHATVVVFFSGVEVAGFVGLLRQLFGRTNACVVALCFSSLVAGSSTHAGKRTR